MEVITPPCGVIEVIQQSFNYDNLQKYLEYLLHLDKRAIEQIYQLRLKLDEVIEIKQDIIDIKFKLEVNDKKFDDFNTILVNHQLKLIEVEKQSSAFEEKITLLEKDNTDTKKRLPLMEDNLNNLNKLTDENCKSIDKINQSVTGYKNILDNHSNAIDIHEKSLIKVNKEIHKLMNMEETFMEFRDISEKKFNKLKQKDAELTNINTLLQNKTEEMESNIAHLTDSLLELSKNVPIYPVGGKMSTKSDHTIDMNKRESMMNDGTITTPNNNLTSKSRDQAFQALVSEFKDHKHKFDKLSKKVRDLKEKFKKKFDGENISSSLKNDSIDQENQINENPNNNEDDNKNNNANVILENQSTTGGYNSQIIKMINVMSENQRVINSAMSLKTSKEDLETLTKNIHSDFDRLKASMGDAFSKIELKIKATNEAAIKRSIDKDEIIHILKEYGKEMIYNEINGIIAIEIKENEIVKKFITRCETNSDEINRIYESIVDLRRQTLDDKLNDPKLNDIDLKALDMKVEEINLSLKFLKSLFDEHFKGLDEDEHSETSGLNLKEIIRNMKGEMRIISDRMEKFSLKQENLGTDILGKIKKDLSGEYIRILDEFRNDLRNSIGKIDLQLQNKVDHILLNDFGRKIDNRLQNEIAKKIDKMDLKKNNNIITKKIDNLENKISKTLVDTLIDLQLEDAPLIVKKGLLGDKCGSCNQLINNGVQNNSQTTYMINLPNNQSNKTVNQSHEDTRYKLRKIQDNSYKYGTGSYSRVLSNANPTTMNEDLHLKNNNSKQYINTSVHLPDINSSGTFTRKVMDEIPNVRKSLNKDENKDLSLGNGLNEEFDKKIVKADNLIKASIKYYDNIEKKK